ncbi:MAG: DUF4337 domain-containing protein [Hyphomicrobiaceae bacterium]
MLAKISAFLEAYLVDEKSREKRIGIFIGLLAVMLAVVSTGGGNATKDATLRNIEATNLWSFFQAKNLRRSTYQLAADELELMLKLMPAAPAEARAATEAKIKSYREQIARLTSDKERNEGLDELFVRAKTVEAQRDLAMRRDPYFDLSQAFLQIAIVLASVAIISSGNMLLMGSLALAILGTLLGLNGFVLLVPIPFVE